MGSYVSTIGAINDLYNVHMSTNRFENQKHGIELSGLVLVEVLDMLRLFSSWITEMRESASPSLQIDLFKDLSKYLFKFCKVISVTLQRTEILWFQDVFQKTTKPYVTIYNLLICNSTMVRRSKR